MLLNGTTQKPLRARRLIESEKHYSSNNHNMAATTNAGEVPTFKLVLVGDGGTGALFLFFSFSSSSSSSRLLCDDDDDRFSLGA